MTQPSPIAAALLIVYVSLVATVDLRTQRIPNALSAIAAALGLLVQASLDGSAGVLAALGGAAAGLGLFLPFYLLRAFGAGDVKAMATVGIFLGATATLFAAACTLIAGAIVGVILLVRASGREGAQYRLAGLAADPIASLDASRNPGSLPTRRFAYGGAIALGTVAALAVMAAGLAPF